MKRRVTGPAICLLFCAMGLVGAPRTAFADGSVSSEGAGVSSPLGGSLAISESLNEGEELVAEREARLASPEAVAAREASRTKFENLGAEQAASVAREAFPGVIDDLAGGPPRLPVGQSIAGYPSDDAAKVDLGEGRQGVLESLAPIAIEGSAGRRVPVDLSLSAVGGGFEPRTPVVGVRIVGAGEKLTPFAG